MTSNRAVLLLAAAAVSAHIGCTAETVGDVSLPLSSVTWQNAVNVTTSADAIEKTGPAGWNAGASSVETIDGDGAVEFSTGESDTNKMFGLNNGDADAGYADLDFAIYLRANRNIRVYENGFDRGSFGKYNAFDMFRIEVVGSEVRYSRNGTVFYTSALAPAFPLNVDSSLHTTGATIQDVQFGPTVASFWQNEVNVATSANDLLKTGTAGWNAGASTTDSISGDGYVEFTTAEADSNKMGGLSNGDSDASYTDIDYAVYLRQNGQVAIYESGSFLGNFSSYVAGDVFRVETVGGVVNYRQNGTLLYTSMVAPSFPLLFDSSLYSPDSTIEDVVITATPFWQFETGVSTTSNDLVKTAPKGWNAGASTTESIAADGYVEFTTAEATTNKMAGLSNGDSTASYEDIDFAFYMRADGRLRVYESGTDRGHVGLYSAGDTLRIEVTAGVVTYAHNGTVVYTSTATPVSPLLLDTSLYSTGATIEDVVFGP